MSQEQHELSVGDNALAIQELDSSNAIGSVLEYYSSYITEQVDKLVGNRLSINGIALLDKDDIIQLVYIKFWLALKKKHIVHPRAYIKSMIYNEFVSVLRKCKPGLSLSINDEEGEVRESSAMLVSCEEKDLPEFQVEQEDMALLCARRAAEAISTLAPRQKRAMECILHEHIDAYGQFNEIFRNCNLNIENALWPSKKADKQLLKASLSEARTNVALRMNFNLKLYKQKGASYLSCDIADL